MHQESDPKSTEVSAKHLINCHIHWIKCQVLYVEEHFRCSLVRTIQASVFPWRIFCLQRKKYSNSDNKLSS